MQKDIAEILKEVKLPERSEVKGAADAHRIEVAPLLKEIDSQAAPEPEVPAAHPDAPAPDSVAAMHTLKQDLQYVVKDQKITLTRAAALEADRRRAESVEEPVRRPSPTSSRARGIVLSAIALFALGAAALFGVYYVQSSQTASVTPPHNDSLLFAEQSVTLPLTGHGSAALKQTLLDARTNSNASLGSITRIVPLVGTDAASARPATLSEFFSAIGAHPPDDLMRALGDQFFFGLHTVDKNAPLFVIPVVSYDRAFAGMLTWESTMNADLSPFFTPVPQYTNESGVPTARAFSDLVMRNYDVRALKDDSGTTQLYYSFPTRSILIIAESPYTFAEVLTRLQASRRL